MELLNPEKHNQITGTATTPDATRSERATQFKGDEAAFWPALKEPYVAIIGVTDTAILLSTADEKISHDFAEILDNTREQHPEAVLSIDYREHPHFTEAWLGDPKMRSSPSWEHSGGRAQTRDSPDGRRGCCATYLPRSRSRPSDRTTH
jgi:hypothetical protein